VLPKPSLLWRTISPAWSIACCANDRGAASDRKKYWRRLLNRARLRAGLRIAPPSVKGASTVENRTTDYETLQSPWTPRGSRITTKPYGSFSGVPHVPLAGDLGGEASELRALFFDHVPAMSVSGFATAACAGDCGVEWHGNGRIAGGGCVSRLALQLETGKTAGLPKVVTPLPARGFCGTLPVLQPLLHFPRNHPAQGPLDTRDLANAFRESRPKRRRA
jgi:hypothetical protein